MKQLAHSKKQGGFFPLLSKKKCCIAVIVIAVFVVCGIMGAKHSADLPITEDELCQLQALMSDHTALDQVLSQNGYTKSKDTSPAYYKMEVNGQNNIVINIKLDQRSEDDGNTCDFHSHRSSVPGVEWGHTFTLSYEGVEIFMRELSSNKQPEFINDEITLLLTSRP